MRKGTGLRKVEYAQAMRYMNEFVRGQGKPEFQVKLRGKREPVEGLRRSIKRMVEDLKSLRADMVIYYKNGSVEIVECKERAYAGSVGQLIVYEQLLKKNYGGMIMKTIICRSIQEDVKAACVEIGIKVVVYDDI